MTWALKRQIFYVGVLVLVISVFSFLIISPRFNKPPTCFDSKQNGDETGIDCGGSCARACPSQVDELSILWARAFKVIPGRYNAVAYFENHNQDVVVQKINYIFRFADANNVYIGKREGSTYVPPSGRFAVFEPGIDIGNSIPVYVDFEFTETPEWTTTPQEKINQLQVLVSNINLVNEDTTPALSATIKNHSFFIVREIDVIAILYDANRNAVSASRTYIDFLVAEESRDVHFTWPEPLPGQVVSIEIIPMYNIDLAQLK
ncbi:MAG: hypothetical protein WD963_00375 [Candidatus Paceibacterota bacterium]